MAKAGAAGRFSLYAKVQLRGIGCALCFPFGITIRCFVSKGAERPVVSHIVLANRGSGSRIYHLSPEESDCDDVALVPVEVDAEASNFVEAERGARRASRGIENCEDAYILPIEELAVEGNSAPAVRAQTFDVVLAADHPRYSKAALGGTTFGHLSENILREPALAFAAEATRSRVVLPALGPLTDVLVELLEEDAQASFIFRSCMSYTKALVLGSVITGACEGTLLVKVTDVFAAGIIPADLGQGEGGGIEMAD